MIPTYDIESTELFNNYKQQLPIYTTLLERFKSNFLGQDPRKLILATTPGSKLHSQCNVVILLENMIDVLNAENLDAFVELEPKLYKAVKIAMPLVN